MSKENTLPLLDDDGELAADAQDLSAGEYAWLLVAGGLDARQVTTRISCGLAL
jgi:hypothetical protein